MTDEQLLQELEAVFTKLGFNIRFEKGDFKGGVCRVYDDNVIIVNKKFEIKKQIRVLCRELGKFDLENIFILPKVREMIEENRT